MDTKAHFAAVLGRKGFAASTNFVPSTVYQGRRDGYVYTTRDGQTGYYYDGDATKAPTGGLKRAREYDDNESGYNESMTVGDRVHNTGRSLSAADLLAAAEKQAANESVIDYDLTEATLKTLVLGFEKKITKNTKMRVKVRLMSAHTIPLSFSRILLISNAFSQHAETPANYMESELELDDEIKKLFAVAASPELYPTFVSLGAVRSLLGLLTHDNTDVSLSVISLLVELTDPEMAEEASDEMQAFVGALLDAQGLELLVQNLARLDESNSTEDFDGVHATLSVLENLSEVRPSICGLLCRRTTILAYLLQRLQPRIFDSNKQYAGEMLSILLQVEDNGRLLGELEGVDGVDELLKAIAYYRKREPTGEEEEELVENMFNALVATLRESPANQGKFRECEGFQLMVRCMKEKNHAGICALRVLDVAIAGMPANASAFVSAGGLTVAFPAFMGKGVVGAVGLTGSATLNCKTLKKRKRRKREGIRAAGDTTADEIRAESEALALISTLSVELHSGHMSNIASNSSSSNRDSLPRLVAKFLEGDLLKVDRLVELYLEYSDKVAEFDGSVGLGDDDEEDADLNEEDFEELYGMTRGERRYSRRLDSGLFQAIAATKVMATISAHSIRCRSHLHKKLHEKGRSISEARRVFVSHVNMLHRLVGEATAMASQGNPESEDGEETKEEAAAKRGISKRAAEVELIAQLATSLSDKSYEPEKDF